MIIKDSEKFIETHVLKIHYIQEEDKRGCNIKIYFDFHLKGSNYFFWFYKDKRVGKIIYNFITENYEKDKYCTLDIGDLEEKLNEMFEVLKQEKDKNKQEKILKQTKVKHGLSFASSDVLDGALSLT